MAFCAHGWQRKGGPVMTRNTWPLSFRKSTVVASIRVRGRQPFLRGFYGNPTLRAMHSIHKCVAKGAPHLFHWRLSSVSGKTGRTVYSQKQKQRLVSKLPDRCFRFDFAWLVTLNILFVCSPGICYTIFNMTFVGGELWWVYNRRAVILRRFAI